MEFIVTKDYKSMSTLAAERIVEQVRENPRSVLGLATGSTPEGLYAELVAAYRVGDVDFAGITTFNLDEYCGLSPDHSQSYHYFMREHLISHVNIDEARAFIPNEELVNDRPAWETYSARMDAAGGVDLQLLGIGQNGHIGFNEPDDNFSKGCHIVELTESTIQANSRLFDSVDEVPRRAYTMGIGDIMKARRVILVASGDSKAESVRDSFFGPVTPRIPASILQFHHNICVIVDEAAAKLCPVG